MKALRLVIATGLMTAMLGISAPAQANDCSNQKPTQQCGGCRLNPDFSTEDLRPIVCYF